MLDAFTSKGPKLPSSATRRPTVRHKPLWVMGVVFILGVSAAFALRNAGHETLEWELAKMSLQVAVVAVAGALLSYVADDYRRSEEKLRFRENFLKEILKRITASYNKSKGARRMARAALIPVADPEHVKLEAYDKCIADVNDAQLELEASGQASQYSLRSSFEKTGSLKRQS